MNKVNLNKIIKEKSIELGFNFIGFTSPHTIKDSFLDKWLGLNYHASMRWMHSSQNERNNIFKYFPEVKTIISFAYNYYTKSDDKRSNYKVSNYSWGNDYHYVIKNKLYEIIEDIKKYCNCSSQRRRMFYSYRS